MMNWSLFSGFFVFTTVSGFTPGPNNLIALSSGATYGYRRTLPHAIGVSLGFAFMLTLMGAGIGVMFEKFPFIYTLLKWGSLAYLLFLAWKLAHSKGLTDKKAKDKPMTVLGSAAFQWVNPKAWMAAITIVTVFAPVHSYWVGMGIYVATNLVIAFAAISMWAIFGTVMKTWLSTPRRLAVFNWSMAVLLILSIIPSFTS